MIHWHTPHDTRADGGAREAQRRTARDLCSVISETCWWYNRSSCAMRDSMGAC